jgi:hypothetical protein
MKVIVVFAMLALCSGTMTSKDRTITQVVKLLQGMLEKSKKEGDEERKIYAKFKCYCDTSEAEKTASIKKETENIVCLRARSRSSRATLVGLAVSVLISRPRWQTTSRRGQMPQPCAKRKTKHSKLRRQT